MSDDTPRPCVAVRLEGGLGDHILGMRVLRFVRTRYPSHDLVIYSDANGHEGPLQIARMSPFVTRVEAVRRREAPKSRQEMGQIDALRDEDLQRMRAADVFIDAAGAQFFAPASVLLDVPIFDIFAHRPELTIPADASREAERLLAAHRQSGQTAFVSMNLQKHGVDGLELFAPRLTQILESLLDDPRVVILNLFTSSYDFAHWPDEDRVARRRAAREAALFLGRLSHLSDRIIACADLPLPVVAAILTRTCYFLGLDNGIKHLAWALGVPHTLLHPIAPDFPRIARWMPDLHRMLRLDDDEAALGRHLAAMHAAIARSVR